MNEDVLEEVLVDILADIDNMADEYDIDPYALCDAVLESLPERIKTWKFGEWEVIT